ncbi:MAG: cytochrome c maturation protein CcmE [Rhodospirillales bacterium]|nr:cytochrome c maturation protein CcmE [Rhodospirillales bacterium]
MKRKHQRMTLLGAGGLAVAAAAALVLTAFEGNIVFFHSPSELSERNFSPTQRLRIGGLVEAGSVAKAADGVSVSFTVTDTAKSMPVTFEGILPDLFREGQGIVAEGHLHEGVFVATEVLAKHDETYMPPEVAEAIKKSGRWKGGR